jgi:DNA-binding transcriptional ArsR family regulator
MHKISLSAHKFKVEERRRKISSLLAQSMSETKIAQELNVDQSTISRDIRVLKQLSQQFVFDLAKSDLAYYYKQSIDGIDEARKELWKIYNNGKLTVKEKVLTLKIIIQSNESKFKLLAEGPSVLAVKSLEERLNKIESAGQISQ